jgi:hypothetical protein
VISTANFRPSSVCIIELVIIFIGLMQYVSLGVSACYVMSRHIMVNSRNTVRFQGNPATS